MKRMLMAGIVFVAALAGAEDKRADVLLQAAQAKETVQGDLKAAIELYGQAVKEAGANRALAAKALIQMAECYQKLGDAEARKIYERVLREYADQKEAAVARARMGGGGTAPAAPTVRQIWISRASVEPSVLSPDGRYICFTDWETGDLGVRDLATGASRRLTNTGGWEASGDYAEGSVISPDGRQVAYSWFMEKELRNELRVVPIGGGAPRTVHRSDDLREYTYPQGWSPDGKQLLVIRTLPDSTKQIAMLSVQDGSFRALKSFAWQNLNATLSPDGRYVAYHAPADGKTQARDISLLAADGSRETAVVQNPADDFSPVWSPDGSRILFLSDRTGNHSLWSVPIEDGKAKGPVELVRADMGRITPLGMSRSGALYYVPRGASNRRNIYIADLGDDMKVSKEPVLATERFVNSNIGPALSPDGQRLAYYSVRPGSSYLVIRTLKTGQERDLPLGQGVAPLFGSGPQWFPDGRSMLVLSRESQRQGLGFYRVDLTSGNSEMLHHVKQAGFQGLALSPDAKTIFYTQVSDERTALTTRLMRFDLESRRETELKNGEWFISPAISPDGKQLAYLVSVRPGSSSYLAIMPSAGGESREVFRGSPWMDGSRYGALAWTPDQRYLLFVRGGVADSTPNVLWRVPVTGGQPEQMGLSMIGHIKTPQIHPDDRRIFFGAMEGGPAEVWALENFLPSLRAAR